MVPRPMRQPNIEDSSKLRASRDDRRAARSGQMYPSYDKTDGLYSNASPAALLDGSVEKVQLHHQVGYLPHSSPFHLTTSRE